MVIRSLIFTVLLCSASFAFGVTKISSPISYAACGDTDVVGSQLGPPEGRFSLYEPQGQCAKLCKSTASACKTAVKGITTCQDHALELFKAISFSECERVNGHSSPATKGCKQGTIAAVVANQQDVKENRALNFAACDQWGTTCRETCIHP